MSKGAADKISRETLEELLQNAESSWEICNYTHLLREIEECDYFSEQAKKCAGRFWGGILEVWEKEALGIWQAIKYWLHGKKFERKI